MFLAVLIVACGSASAALLSVQGDAHDPASERLLYREDHVIRHNGDVPVERVVLYRCPGGTVFARKRVDYRASRTAPDFSLTDARDGYREGLRREHGAVTLFSGNRRNTVPAVADPPLVADAGFDEFLRIRWDALQSGDALPIRFAVPSFGKGLGFNVRSLGQGSIDGLPVQTFSLKLSGMLALVSPRIDVAYSARDRSLRRFTGVSNIRNDRGKSLQVRIDFTRPPQAASDAQWHDALDAPLASCKLGV